jgi:hypothetical protein
MWRSQFKAGAVVSLTLAICLCPAISRGQAAGDTDIVPAGPDMFVTQPGTFFSLPGIGQINFLGVPNAQGVDTIVQRLKSINVPDVVGATETVPIQLTLLDLKSTAPVNIGGSFFDVFATLNPNAPPSTTSNLVFTQMINGEGPVEGTFTSTLDVNFMLTFEQDGKVVPCPAQLQTALPNCDGSVTLTGNGHWTDDLGGAGWLNGGFVLERGPMEAHMARIIPEPASLLLIGAGLLGGLLCKRLFYSA